MFDLAVMTGHVFQVFLADTDVAVALSNASSRLAAGGRLSFETRNPASRPWECWTPQASTRTLTVDGLGEVVTSHRLVDVTGDVIAFETTYELVAMSERVVTTSSLRFMGDLALREHLDAADFDRVTLYGDWDRSPVSSTSPEIIVVARRS